VKRAVFIYRQLQGLLDQDPRKGNINPEEGSPPAVRGESIPKVNKGMAGLLGTRIVLFDSGGRGVPNPSVSSKRLAVE
jgi:hypothetical protein